MKHVLGKRPGNDARERLPNQQIHEGQIGYGGAKKQVGALRHPVFVFPAHLLREPFEPFRFRPREPELEPTVRPG